MSELDGFVIYKPKHSNEKMYLSVRKKGVGITQAVLEALHDAEYVNVFFDEMKHRVMLKYAEADFENTLKVGNYGRSGRMINSLDIAEKLRGWYGNAQVAGHVAGDGILIFELPTGKAR